MGRQSSRATGEPDTPERILRAAEIAFAEDGFDGARLGDIADVAGIRRPSLLYHFPTKHELYCAVVRQTFEALGAAIMAPLGATTSPFEARVEAVFFAFSTFLDARPAAARIVLRELLDGRGPGQAILHEVAVPLVDRVEQFLREEGEGRLRSQLPIRDALLSVVLARLVRKAAREPLASALFDAEDHALSFLRVAFFR